MKHPLWKRLTWKLHRWALRRCGNSSNRMFWVWSWIIDRLESIAGEPPYITEIHRIVASLIDDQGEIISTKP